MEKFPIDGTTSLTDQQNTLRFLELAGPFKLLTYTKQADPANPDAKPNSATFDKLPLGAPVPQLILIAVEAGQNAADIIATQLAAGKRIVFHETVFVSGNDAEVIGFR